MNGVDKSAHSRGGRHAIASRGSLPGWLRLAACAGKPEATFFPARDESPDAALRICALCPVRRECLSYAMENDERFGIWGGRTEAERRRMRESDRATAGRGGGVRLGAVGRHRSATWAHHGGVDHG